MSANCPHCARDLAKNQAGKHCRPTDSTTCTWLNCRCGSVVDVKTGKIKWHYQSTPHDHWDFDGVNEFVPFDLNKGGKTIKAGDKISHELVIPSGVVIASETGSGMECVTATASKRNGPISKVSPAL